VSVQAVEAPLRLPSALDCARFEHESFGALQQMLSSVPEEERSSVWLEIENVLARFETSEGFVGSRELLVLARRRPPDDCEQNRRNHGPVVAALPTLSSSS
jgi:hypothetical protein